MEAPRVGRAGGKAVTLAAVALGVVVALVAVAALGGLAACGSDAPPPDGTPASAVPVPTAPTEARAQLAAAAAAAKDRRMVAFYTLRVPNRPDRTVAVTLAVDGSWRIDVPGGALGGTADVAIAANSTGLYQCGLPTTTTPGTGCVKIGGPDGTPPVAVDPRVQHVLIDWRDVFLDRRAPLNVAATDAPAGVTGACFSVEPTAASLAAPVDPGVYCYAPDGALTAAVAGFGTLVLAGPPSPAPPTAPLPGPVVPGPPLKTSPPPPPPSPTASPTPRG